MTTNVGTLVAPGWGKSVAIIDLSRPDHPREVTYAALDAETNAVAASQAAGREAVGDRVGLGVQVGVGDFAWAIGPREIDDRDALAPPRRDQRADVGGHGRMMILPKSSRASITRMASRDSANGKTRSMIGVMVPRSTSTSSASRS